MKIRYSPGLIAVLILIFAAVSWTIIRNRAVSPRVLPAPGRREESKSEKPQLYWIIDRSNGKTLMILDTGPISVGDELITEDNRRFVVTEVKGNKGYAKFIERVDLQKNQRSVPRKLP